MIEEIGFDIDHPQEALSWVATLDEERDVIPVIDLEDIVSARNCLNERGFYRVNVKVVWNSSRERLVPSAGAFLIGLVIYVPMGVLLIDI